MACVWHIAGNGLGFHCPGCDGVHVVSVSPGMWKFNGDLDFPTLSPSVLVNKGQACPELPVCHSWIVDGQILFLPDSTHHLAGQTVDLPEDGRGP